MLEILDTTLREGEQTPYVNFTVEEKYLLDELEKHSDVEIIRINDGDQYFDISQIPKPVDVLKARLWFMEPFACQSRQSLCGGSFH